MKNNTRSSNASPSVTLSLSMKQAEFVRKVLLERYPFPAAPMAPEVAELIGKAMVDRITALPVKLTKAQHARLVAAAEIIGAPVDDILTAHVTAGLDWDTDVLEDALEAVSGSLNAYATERRTLDRPGSRHPLQVCNGATA